MATISAVGIDASVIRGILIFLNGASSPEEIAADFPNFTNEIGLTVAKRIYEKREKLGGFKDLSELSDIRGFGEDKFEDLVQYFSTIGNTGGYSEINTIEPLFRFSSLRYHQVPAMVATKKNTIAEVQIAQTQVTKQLTGLEKNQLLVMHSTVLSRSTSAFLQDLEHALSIVAQEYFDAKSVAQTQAERTYRETVQKAIKKYEDGLSAEERAQLDTKKRLSSSSECHKEGYSGILEQSNLYPEGIIPVFAWSYEELLSEGYLKDKITRAHLEYLKQNRLLHKEYIDVAEHITRALGEQQKSASSGQLRHKQSVLVKGASITVKFNFDQAYVLSLDPRYKIAYLSLVLPENHQQITGLVTEIQSDSETFQIDSFEKVYCNGRLVTLQISLRDIPITTNYCVAVRMELIVDKSNTIVLLEQFSTLVSTQVNRYSWQGDTAVQKMESFTTNTDLHGIIRLGWADFMRVEQKLCCYVPGAIAHIENIMAREYREKVTDYLERSETTIVTETETETIHKNDTTSVEKHDWNKEIKNTLTRDFKFNLGTNISYGSKDSGTWYVGINADMSFANSRTISNTNSESYSKSVTDQASESIRVKSFESRTSALIKEFKEQNKHGFDNRSGNEHVSGVFRWIDKIYKNQIVNYGKGMLYEFMIPKPSEMYVKTLVEDEEVQLPTAPTPPNIKSWQEITRDNYMNYINQYGVTDFQAPMDLLKYDKFEMGRMDHEFIFPHTIKIDKTFTFAFRSDIGANYNLEEVVGTSSYSLHGHNPIPVDPNGIFQIHLKNAGGQVKIAERFINSIMFNYAMSGNIHKTGLNFDNQVDVHVFGNRVATVDHVTLNVRFRLKQSVYQQWQQDTYNSIMDAYNAQVQAYQDQMDALTNGTGNMDASLFDAEKYKNPGAYIEIIETELRRLCIELMLQKVDIDRCANYYILDQCEQTKDCGIVPIIDKTKLADFDKRASLVKFMEQCFLWPVLSYNLYKYYWADQCEWGDLLHNEDTPDNKFQEFLKSGMARVIVPVREGFEKAVAYFMETGEPWFGNEPPTMDDNQMFVSIVDELALPVGKIIGDPWNTTVPSTLTLLQGESVYLKGEGLPCCEELGGKTGISSTDFKLEPGKSGTPE